MSVVTLGGQRLHGGGKMTVEMTPYKGAKHNLSKKIRTSMAPGVLVPVYKNIMLPGDKWNINLLAAIKTIPAIGPLYGSFEICLDVFQTRMSLYNKRLHNDRVSLAREMDTVYLPTVELTGPNPAATAYRSQGINNNNRMQINQSSAMAYLGRRGLGAFEDTTGVIANRYIVTKNPAVMYINYADISKEYYFNKQEEFAYVIGTRIEQWPTVLDWWTVIGAPTQRLASTVQQRLQTINAQHFNVYGQGLRQTVGEDGKLGSGVAFVLSDYPGGPVTIEMDPDTGVWNFPEGTTVTQIAWHQATAQNGEAAQFQMIRTDSTDKGTYSLGIKNSSISTTSFITRASLDKFPIARIDEMRDAILAAPKEVPFNINNRAALTTVEEYEAQLPWSTLNTQLKVFGGDQEQGLPFQGSSTQLGNNAGLFVKTYKSDRFNVWLDTDFVENLTEAVSVAVVDGKISINDLNTAEKLYNIESRIAASNQTYKGWIQAAYGITPNIAAEMPIYKGGCSGMIMFDEVVSKSATETNGQIQPLGTLAGRGVMSDFGGGNIHLEAEEPSIIMVIAHITPIVGYSSGNNWTTRLETFDDLHKPEYDKIGYQPLVTDELAAWSTPMLPTGEITADGFPIRARSYQSAGKQVAWSEYMTDVDENYGDFTTGESLEFMVLNRDYEAEFENDDESSNFEISDLTTYINPSKHNYMFADTSLDAQNFWLHCKIDVSPYRIVAAKQIPRM